MDGGAPGDGDARGRVDMAGNVEGIEAAQDLREGSRGDGPDGNICVTRE